VREGARVVPRSKQPRRSQVASRGDARAAGRARTGGAKSPGRKKLPWSVGCECMAFMAAIRGDSKFREAITLLDRKIAS
jgi:hypothetical protein